MKVNMTMSKKKILGILSFFLSSITYSKLSRDEQKIKKQKLIKFLDTSGLGNQFQKLELNHSILTQYLIGIKCWIPKNPWTVEHLERQHFWRRYFGLSTVWHSGVWSLLTWTMNIFNFSSCRTFQELLGHKKIWRNLKTAWD